MQPWECLDEHGLTHTHIENLFTHFRNINNQHPPSNSHNRVQIELGFPCCSLQEALLDVHRNKRYHEVGTWSTVYEPIQFIHRSNPVNHWMMLCERNHTYPILGEPIRILKERRAVGSDPEPHYAFWRGQYWRILIHWNIPVPSNIYLNQNTVLNPSLHLNPLENLTASFRRASESMGAIGRNTEAVMPLYIDTEALMTPEAMSRWERTLNKYDGKKRKEPPKEIEEAKSEDDDDDDRWADI